MRRASYSRNKKQNTQLSASHATTSLISLIGTENSCHLDRAGRCRQGLRDRRAEIIAAGHMRPMRLRPEPVTKPRSWRAALAKTEDMAAAMACRRHAAPISTNTLEDESLSALIFDSREGDLRALLWHVRCLWTCLGMVRTRRRRCAEIAILGVV